MVTFINNGTIGQATPAEGFSEPRVRATAADGEKYIFLTESAATFWLWLKDEISRGNLARFKAIHG